MTNDLAAAWTLDPEIDYLNHGSFGATPRAVLEVQDRWRARLEREPVRFLARDLWEELARAREAVGAFIGASAEDLAFVPNATTGVNTVLRSLRFEPGDELIVTDHGYNACSNTVRYVAEREGATVRVAEVPFPIAGPQDVVDAIHAVVSDRTRLVLIDHVTSPTGLVLPVERLVAPLQEREIQVLVDGAHAPGMLPLDLDALDADYYTGNFHKWVCAPKGAAFLHVRKDRQAGLAPWIISHGRNAPLGDTTRFRLEFDWTGTCDPSPWLCMADSIETVGGMVDGGWDAVRRHNNDLARRGRDLVCDALGIEAPAPDEMLASLAALPLPAGTTTTSPGAFDVDPLQARLYDESRIEVPVFPWPQAPQRLIRLSAQLYNEEAQYHRLAESLSRYLPSRDV